MGKAIFIFFVLLCCHVLQTSGQATRIYDNRDYGFGELSSNLINSIAQDKEGYIWTGTEYGLNKFDGIRFVQYMHDVNDSTSISSNNIKIVYVDHQKRLWVGCNNGLQYYDPNHDNFVRIHFPDHIAPHITDIVHLKNGGLWVATSGWGIFEIRMKEKHALPLIKINELSGSMFSRSIFEDNKNNIWVASDDKELVCVTFSLHRIPLVGTTDLPQPKGSNFDILQTADGRLLFASHAQISIYDPLSKKVEQVSFQKIRSSSITEVQFDKSLGNQLIISTEGDGLWYLDVSKHPLIAIQADLPNFDKSYSQGRIRTFLQDREKNIWLGWFQRGLVFIPVRSNQFEFWRILDLEESDKKSIRAVTKDHTGRIWYAVENKGIFVSDNAGISHRHISDQYDVSRMEVDVDGLLWFSSHSRGLGQIDPKTYQVRYFDTGSNRQARTFALGQDHKIYISTFGTGFVAYDQKTGATEQYSMNNKSSTMGRLANDWIVSMLCDENGLIWLGHHKGISCFDPKKGTFSHQFSNTNLSEQIVISLLSDRQGNIWAGTYNGLYRIDQKTGKVHSITTNNGLSSNVISGMCEDSYGNIWCSTFKGINSLNPKTLKIVNYYTGDGLVDRYYNRGVSFQDVTGTIYFGGKQGITSFIPEKISLKSYPYSILITNLYIKNQPVKPNVPVGKKPIYTNNLNNNEGLFLNSDEDSFTLELSTMDFNSPENVHYEYRIKGINKTWNATLPGVNLITYNNLSAGDHELEIRACKFGAYSQTRTVMLHILPPWYQSGIAYFIYTLFVLGVILLIVRYLHERRLERQHAYKLQLFTDISHEIRTPLTLVISPLDKLIKQVEDLQTRSTLSNMNRNAQKILSLVNQLLDIRKIESGHTNLMFTHINAVEFIHKIILDFEHEARAHRMTIKIHSDVDHIFIWADENSFEKIVRNILFNAFKFTPDGGAIDIRLATKYTKDKFKKKSEVLQLVITDTGIGIAEKDLPHIFKLFYQSSNPSKTHHQGSGIGLHLAQVLAHKHQGEIKVENRTDSDGTRFTIRLPLAKEYLKPSQIPTTTFSKNDVQIHQEETAEYYLKTKLSNYVKTGYKLLVVDDDKDIIQYLQQELEHIYKVYTSENGSDAFQIALSLMPDLIISDISMPSMDGYTLVKKVKDNSYTNHIPIILLTARADQKDRLEGIHRGADAYLTKPFLIEELLMLTENLIKNRMKIKGKFSGAQQQEGNIKTITFKSSDELLMDRIVKTVNKYLENPELNVQFLADEVGLSRVQLHRKVKSLTGISTGEFIRNARLSQAEKLLLEKKMNISQVAYALGFTNQTHFTTLFKKTYGLSPTEYIDRHATKK